ncbi:hypothetical protein RV420_340045 [Roseovarius sp. EC-SD190]|nr:hypothetical protein RV420_340045 [Roseovarius sp. EC-SD190]
MLAIGSKPLTPAATSPSAIPCTSNSCMPQKSAICLKLIVVLSTSQTAVALAMIGFDISQVSFTQNFPGA